jgi:hypothetical protein
LIVTPFASRSFFIPSIILSVAAFEDALVVSLPAYCGNCFKSSSGVFPSTSLGLNAMLLVSSSMKSLIGT